MQIDPRADSSPPQWLFQVPLALDQSITEVTRGQSTGHFSAYNGQTWCLRLQPRDQSGKPSVYFSNVPEEFNSVAMSLTTYHCLSVLFQSTSSLLLAVKSQAHCPRYRLTFRDATERPTFHINSLDMKSDSFILIYNTVIELVLDTCVVCMYIGICK